MLRPTVPEDTPALTALTAATGFFRPHEIETLHVVLDEYHEFAREKDGHHCHTLEAEGRIVGFVYFGPAPMTLGSWQLWWIVVAKDVQAKGLGGQMLRFAEDEMRRRQGRLLFVETSSQPAYDPTRRFYLKNGYEPHAVLKEFYAPGDSMVVFRKELGSA